MKRLYYENQYIKEFEAIIIKKIIEDEKIKVILDKTAFFPGGGGQKNDLGFISNVKVIDTYEENECIVHLLEEDIDAKIGDKVKAEIDWDRRKDGMAQHLGQHILSGSFYKILGRNTVSIHLGKDISTVDIIGELTEEDIIKVNNYANSIIENNRKVSGYFPENEELKYMKLRRDLPVTDKAIRILEIDGLDLTACSGVHFGNTLEVRFIKIKRFEKYKNNTRIYFLAGDRAIKDSLEREILLKSIEKNLSSSGNETINSIKNLKMEIDKLKKDKKVLEEEVIKSEIKEILSQVKRYEDLDFICKIFKDKDNNLIRSLANKIVKEDNRIILLINEEKKSINIILASSKNVKEINLREISFKHIDIICGKGGGSSNRVEILGEKKNLEQFIDKIEEEIRSKKII